ncbi:MAG: ferrous iron transport protein A [Synergistaceae bacterium]|jgi:ferrous iron transport protein A|nr:ferrous iron transport protein A [Synergistaceae bacterium]
MENLLVSGIILLFFVIAARRIFSRRGCGCGYCHSAFGGRVKIHDIGGKAMTMAEVKKGNFYIIKEISGDRRFISRVTSAGLTPGTKLEILQKGGGLPVLVYARDTMLAVNGREARQITVETAS